MGAAVTFLDGRVQLYLGDSREILPSLGRVGAAILSPPYNLGGSPWPHLGHWRQGGSVGGKGKWTAGADARRVAYGRHDDAMPWNEYVSWQQQTLSDLWSLLPDDGAIFYNHKPRVIGLRLWSPLELIPPSLLLRQIIIWSRPGGMNFNPTAFVPTYEWVMVLAKPAFRLRSRGVSGLGDVWQLRPDKNPHPAPFPLALPSRILEAIISETIIDPFMGSGTTGVAAVKAGRRFIGIEIEPTFFDMACERIQTATRDMFAPSPASGAP